MYAIIDMQCEPEYQNQNPAERDIQEVTKMARGLLDRTNAPSAFWLLCTLYVIALLNVLALQSLDWKTPTEALHGYKPDISPFLAFRWWEPVYFTDHHADHFPGTQEKLGRIVGIAENQGDLMTWLVLDLETEKVVTRSEVRSAANTKLPNLRAETKIPSLGGEKLTTLTEILDQVNPSSESLPKYTPEQLFGMTYLKELDDGQTIRAQVVRTIKDQDAKNRRKM